MAFTIDENMRIGKVSLKVANLIKQVDFYQNYIGLDVLDSSYDSAELGIQETGEVLLELKKVEKPNSRLKKTGLFHIAFLLPTRKDLGNILYALIKKQASISGASDHGYSEAIYLQDSEGNGIEIYRDKPKEEWDIRENGRIVGITAEMDANGVLAAKDENVVERLPKGTTIGHVHLSVSDLGATEDFYTKLMGLSLKDQFGDQARFFAAGEYHHHIGSNTWLGEGIPAAEEQDLGLNFFTVIIPDANNFERLKDTVEKVDVAEIGSNKNELVLLDPNGIKVKVLKAVEC